MTGALRCIFLAETFATHWAKLMEELFLFQSIASESVQVACATEKPAKGKAAQANKKV